MQTATDPLATINTVFATYPLPADDWGWATRNGQCLYCTPSGFGTQKDWIGKLIQLKPHWFVKGRKGDGKRLLSFAREEAERLSTDLAQHVTLDKAQVVGRKRVIETLRTTRRKCEVSVEWRGPVDNGSVRFVLPPPFVTYRGKSGFVYRALVQE
jgi:hypothetical protein